MSSDNGVKHSKSLNIFRVHLNDGANEPDYNMVYEHHNMNLL
jgi:hypothetical protein